MPGVNVNQAGTIKSATAIYANVAGVVKTVLEGWVNQAGTVKKFWPSVGVPGAPGNYRVTGSTASDLSLAWNASVANGSPVTGYRIEYGTDGVNFPTGQTFGSGSTSGTLVGLAASTLYYTRIKATSALGDSAYSFAQGTTSIATAPQAPSLVYTGASSSSVNLRITAGGGGTPTSYIVEYAVNSTGGGSDPTAWIAAGTPAYTGSPQTFTVNGLYAAGCFAFRARAVNGAGTSANSSLAWAGTSGDVANGSVSCGTDPEDIGAFKDTGWGSNSAASGNAGQAFGSIFPGSLNGITIARFARSGSTTMTIWLEGASVPSDLFSRISFGDGRYSYSAQVGPAGSGGGPSGTLWTSSWSAPSSAIGSWLDGANVSFAIGR